jgi:hypothetical protein
MQEKSTPTSTMTSEPEAAALAIIRLDGFCLLRRVLAQAGLIIFACGRS